MRSIVKIILLFSIVCFFSGCQGETNDISFRDDKAYDERNGFAASLTLGYESFRKNYPEFSNEVCYYVMAQNKMPEDRKVIFCLTDVYGDGWRKAPAMEITSNGIEISKEQMIYSFGKHFPVDIITKMTGYASVDDLFENVGQVQKYEELGEFCAFSVNHMNERPIYNETIYYGKPNETRFVEISFGELLQQPSQSLQITEKYVYYFVYDYGDLYNSSITIVQIPRDGGEVVTRKILYSDIGLPNLRNRDFAENIFVDGDYLFFLGGFTLSSETLEAEFDVVAYNLSTAEYDVLSIKSIDGVGKLFRFGDKLGVMTAMYDTQGYYSDLAVKFIDFNATVCELSEKSTLSLPLSEKWSYSFEKGREFYCIGETLCGIMTEKNNGASYAYVEVDLETGAVTTFIPFAKKAKQANKGVYYGSLLIRDDGRAVSEHNCS